MRAAALGIIIAALTGGATIERDLPLRTTHQMDGACEWARRPLDRIAYPLLWPGRGLALWTGLISIDRRAARDPGAQACRQSLGAPPGHPWLSAQPANPSGLQAL